MKKKNKKRSRFYFKLGAKPKEYFKEVTSIGMPFERCIDNMGLIFGLPLWVFHKSFILALGIGFFPFYLLSAPKIRIKKKRKNEKRKRETNIF